MAEHVELGLRDRQRFLLEGVCPAVLVEESDEVARRSDRDLLELQVLRGPLGERTFPGQVQQRPGAVAEPKPREGRLDGREIQCGSQSFLRKYAVTVAS